MYLGLYSPNRSPPCSWRVARRMSRARAASFSTVCFRSQQNHMPSPTKTRHGRKQGNGGTHEAAETINSYGLFRSRWGEEPGGFFPSCRDADERRACGGCVLPHHIALPELRCPRRMGRAKRNPSIPPDVRGDGFRFALPILRATVTPHSPTPSPQLKRAPRRLHRRRDEPVHFLHPPRAMRVGV